MRHSRIFAAPARLFLLVAALLLALQPASRAMAQGTSGMLPDPISTRELMRYGDRLGLSDQQRRAIEAFHDEYHKEFRELRDGEIQQFLVQMRNLQGSGMPSRATVESFFKEMDRLTGRIASLDDRLLNRVQTVLTEEQMGRIHRVRLARERARFTSQQMTGMAFMGSPLVDLSEMVIDIEMSPEERLAIDALMESYESRLTNRMNAIYRSTTTMFLQLFDAMESMGFTEETMEDPEAAGKMMEAMQSVMQGIMAKTMEIGAEIKELNHRTYSNAFSSLSTKPARTLRRAYIEKAYPTAMYAFNLVAPKQLEAALTLEGLTDDQRSAIQAQELDLRTRIDRIVDTIIDEADKFNADRTPWSFEQTDWASYHERLNEHQKQLTQLDTAAREVLANLLDHQTMGRVTEKANEEPSEIGPRARVVVEADPEVVEEQQRRHRGPDVFLATAIDARDLNVYARILELTSEERFVLDELHKAYVERYNERTKEPLAKLSEALTAQWSGWQDHESGPDPRTIDRVYEARRAARDVIREADDSFFADIQLALLEENDARLERVKLHRARDVNSRGAMNFYFGSNQASTIDLTRIVRALSFPPSTLAAIDHIVYEYEKALHEALLTRYEASLINQRAQDRWSMAARGGFTSDPNAMRTTYQEIMGDSQRAFAAANDAVIELNNRTLESLMQALPESQSMDLRDAYRRRAFPSIYQDPAAMDKHFRNAQQISTLTPEQTTRLRDAAVKYRAAYTTLSERMVDLTAAMENRHYYDWTTQDEDYWRRQMERQDELSRVRFERNELSARAIGTLKSLLTTEQLSLIGPLPEPPGIEGPVW